MTDYLWPLDICPSRQEWGVLDNAGMFASPLTGSVRTVSRPGARLRCSITTPVLRGTRRARMLGILASLRGRSNRIWVPDFSVTQRGTFPATERFTNNGFASGTTGWSLSANSRYAVTVTDRVARAVRTAVTGTDNVIYQTITTTQYAPYAVRAMLESGSGVHANVGPDISGLVGSYGAVGLRTASAVADSATEVASVSDAASSGMIAGDFFTIPWTSAARCILVDNGPNALLYSDQIDNAAWTKVNTTITAGVTGPNGATDADRIVETTANSSHAITQAGTRTAAAADLCAYGYFKVTGAGRGLRIYVGNDVSANYSVCLFNLTAGTAGSVSNVGTSTNGRAFIQSAGDGWYYCAVVARAASASTLAMYAELADGSSATYVGSTSASVDCWRVGCAPSSMPTRGSQTTTTATTGTSQTGRALYVKGLPASTLGLLRAGDPVQIGTQMNFVASDLDSDAAGKGLLVCGLPWRFSPADNDPVHVNTPMAKMILASEDISWMTGPGQFSEFQLEFVEDVA